MVVNLVYGIIQQLTKCGVTVRLGGEELRVGTSRFLSQGTFLAYKSLMAVFFMSWAIYWREAGASIVLAKCEKHLALFGGAIYICVDFHACA